MKRWIPNRAARWAIGLLAVWTVLDEIDIAVWPGPPHEPFFGGIAYCTIISASAILILARAVRTRGPERLAWWLIGGGAALWAPADIYFTVAYGDGDIAVPSPADAGYVAFYLMVFAGLCLLLRARVAGAPRTLWIDGLTAALAAAALSAAIVLEVVLSTLGGAPVVVATNLAYPVGDLILLGVIMTAFAVTGWRPDRTWALLTAAVGMLSLADSYYLVASANGTYTDPSIFDGAWIACMVLLAAAAWQPERRVRSVVEQGGARFVAFPLVFATVGLVILVVGAVSTLNVVAVVLAAASVLAVFVRLILTLRENAGMLTASRYEALTDALTGLGNRRALVRELDRRLEDPEGARTVLAFFDLDGFKHYNDSFGHPAGDALLARLGAKLSEHVAGVGAAYRMGGDEFCVLVSTEGDPDTVAAGAGAALFEQGEGFAIGASWGAIAMPAEASRPEAAMRLADQRMYAHKQSGRVSARSQSRDVLVSALQERHPSLGEHLAGVADLAEAVARGLDLDEESVEHVRHAAELHDVGKMAIPDAILDKPGPLDDDEWAFIRRHTVIGERIVHAAPALRPVAALVRSSHERYDGTGYPDRLAGDEIPLGARIVAVCDAYDAMVADRRYRAGMEPEDAVAELRRCAGTQFDPAVVQAFNAAQVASRLAVAAV